ncbi:MAG: hypothetical protein U1A27_07510 [Phycisphaerae bacterium]
MRRFRALGLGLGIAFALAAQAQASLLYSVQAIDHPNGDQSSDLLQFDSRDYGLRLDNNYVVHTFSFENVTMDFFTPDAPPDQSTIYARLHGTVAHLQSSDGVSVGYAAGSGIDPLDQRWNMDATFRLIGRTGTFGGGSPVPYFNMLSDLFAAGLGGGMITFALHDLALTPAFVGAAIYDGPTLLDERPGGDGAPVADTFHIQYRERLTDPAFAGPQWDYLGAAGWLEPAVDQPNGDQIRDYLFLLRGVPEPATVALLALGLPLLRRGRRS